jgi:hypothetical protein
VRDHGLLQVFDGDPDEGGTLILSRTVRGLDGRFGTFEQFEWSPPSPGHHVLYARYRGAGVDGRPAIRIPVYVAGSGASANR